MQVKQKYTGNVDWYLYNLSVFSKVQEKGITSKLLRPMFNFCDKENIVCYLETDKNSNVSLYKHFGFELVNKGLMNITRKEGRLERTFNAGHFSFSNNYIPFRATLALENLSHVCLSGFNNYSVMNDSINDSFAMYINAKYI